ncbi:winged helix-turn-helix transcriptional regulator [Luteimicrobium subarcticum]|uniref:HxlR family transcriptional regulator n=1 Tax=Luteimicrobium subarcticum TaxID=620910 RepID=A0A2M8W1L9_9MICO|nr:helix-turn-helix domain-containing protein [Luteimicrobium subarcticum]PJI84810.1 HxlR family transcriptional regulator [Luteimicrobium subarcticum]
MSDYERSCTIRGDDGAAVRSVLDRVADKWTLLVVVTLEPGVMRYSELQRHIPGISQRMLSLTLKHLERDGLVTRTVHAEVPPRVEYELTDVGRSLIGPAVALADWAIRHNPAIEASRAEHEARAAR